MATRVSELEPTVTCSVKVIAYLIMLENVNILVIIARKNITSETVILDPRIF